MIPISCIVCGREFENAGGRDNGWNQPSGGTTFETHGHYGSTVFDPMLKHVSLVIDVCDPCLREAAKQGRVLEANQTEARTPPPTYVWWQAPPD